MFRFLKSALILQIGPKFRNSDRKRALINNFCTKTPDLHRAEIASKTMNNCLHCEGQLFIVLLAISALNPAFSCKIKCVMNRRNFFPSLLKLQYFSCH